MPFPRTHADRPGDRGRIERQRLPDLAQQVERVAALTVELVDEGGDRYIAQPANLEELGGLLLDTLVLLAAASSTIRPRCRVRPPSTANQSERTSSGSLIDRTNSST